MNVIYNKQSIVVSPHPGWGERKNLSNEFVSDEDTEGCRGKRGRRGEGEATPLRGGENNQRAPTPPLHPALSLAGVAPAQYAPTLHWGDSG